MDRKASRRANVYMSGASARVSLLRTKPLQTRSYEDVREKKAGSSNLAGAANGTIEEIDRQWAQQDGRQAGLKELRARLRHMESRIRRFDTRVGVQLAAAGRIRRICETSQRRATARDCEKQKRRTGLEPATSSLGSLRSTN